MGEHIAVSAAGPQIRPQSLSCSRKSGRDLIKVLQLEDLAGDAHREGDGDLNVEAEIAERATERDGIEKPLWPVAGAGVSSRRARMVACLPISTVGAPKGRLRPQEDEVAAGGP